MAIVAVVGLNVGDQHAARLERPGRALTDVKPGPSARSTRPSASTPGSSSEDAYWVQAIAWQGGGLVVDQLERVVAGRL